MSSPTISQHVADRLDTELMYPPGASYSLKVEILFSAWEDALRDVQRLTRALEHIAAGGVGTYDDAARYARAVLRTPEGEHILSKDCWCAPKVEEIPPHGGRA